MLPNTVSLNTKKRTFFASVAHD